MNKQVRLAVVISNQVLRRLRIKLLKQGKTVSQFVREKITEYLKDNE